MTNRPDRRTPRPARSLTLEMPPRGGGAPYLGINLTEADLAAIGRIAVQWSQLEMIVFDMTNATCALMSIEVPIDTAKLSFKVRCRALKAVLRQLFSNDAEALKECEKLFSRIDLYSNKRHKTVHGLWDFDLDDPKNVVVWNNRISKVNPEKTNQKKLQKIASDIAKLSFDLLTIHWSLLERLSLRNTL